MLKCSMAVQRSEINLEKHLAKKGSIIRIQNKDEMCIARALVVLIVEVENDPRDRQIRNSKRPLQTRLAHDLHKIQGFLQMKSSNFKSI